jgi:hypothetical protein
MTTVLSRLGRVFGYGKYDSLGQSAEDMDKDKKRDRLALGSCTREGARENISEVVGGIMMTISLSRFARYCLLSFPRQSSNMTTSSLGTDIEKDFFS